MPSVNFIQVTPFINVPSLEAALVFFCDLLGFEIRYRNDDYAFVRRETVGIRLQENTEDVYAPGNRRFAYYIDVRDVDAVFAELKPKLEALPADHVYGPVDQLYGQRELLIVAPDGNLLVFGQLIERKTTESVPLDLSQRDLRGSRFRNVRLADTAFANVDLSGSTLEDVNATSMAFKNVKLHEARFSNVDFSNAEIVNSRVSGMRIEGILVSDLIAAYRKSQP